MSECGIIQHLFLTQFNQVANDIHKPVLSYEATDIEWCSIDACLRFDVASHKLIRTKIGNNGVYVGLFSFCFCHSTLSSLWYPFNPVLSSCPYQVRHGVETEPS